MIPLIQCPQQALMLMSRLEAAGYEAYVVGGCVRDALLGMLPHDWDITTSAEPTQVKETLRDLRVLDTGLKHGTVTVVLDDLYEITTFRTDGAYSDGRHPDSVTFSRRLRDDAARRDFTINAMAYSPTRGLADFYGGAEDLQGGIIRCVGDANQRMKEDVLRVLRAVRFQARLGFRIAPDTRRAMERRAPELNRVSAERIGAEFLKMLHAPYASRAIRENPTVIACVVPEYDRLLNEPTMANRLARMLRAMELARGDEDGFPREWADEYVDMALFFHELGDELSHGDTSAEAAAARMRSLKYSNERIARVGELLRWHDARLIPERAQARRWMGRLCERRLERLIKTQACIAAAEGKPDALENLRAFDATRQQLRGEGVACSLKELAVNGRDLMNAGIPKGESVGRVLAALLEEVLDEKIPNERGALLIRAAERMRESEEMETSRKNST